MSDLRTLKRTGRRDRAAGEQASRRGPEQRVATRRLEDNRAYAGWYGQPVFGKVRAAFRRMRERRRERIAARRAVHPSRKAARQFLPDGTGTVDGSGGGDGSG